MTGRYVDMMPWDQPPLLDRDAEHRSDEDLQQAWSEDTARVLDLDRSSRFHPDRLGIPTAGVFDEHVAYLGRVNGQAWFARRVESIDQGRTIREVPLDASSAQLVMAGLAVLAWGEQAPSCPWCGGRVNLTKGGFAAVCAICSREHFPRTDPAIIVGIVDDADRLFLAHQASWGRWRASILAGFIEAGESAENAIHREVAEEAKLSLSAVRYLGSQPWPFPRSLMLSFVARGHGPGEVDHEELQWGGWFTREEVADRLADGTLDLPGMGSVAARIIDAWRQDRLPRPEGDD